MRVCDNNMYHGKQGEVPYSTTTKHHNSASRRIGDILLKYIGTEQRSQVNKKELVFADFGTSDGVLALDIFKKIIEIPDVGYSHYSIYLNDIPVNDFNMLSAKISDSDIYKRDDVSIMMNVGNMYNKCVPPGSLTIATSISALQFLDDINILSGEEKWLHDSLFTSFNRERFAALAARDWTHFLDARSSELTAGGILVANLLLESRYPFVHLMSEEWDVALKTGLVKKEEHQRCLIPLVWRTPEEVMEPFKDGVYKDLKLLSTDVYTIDYVKQDPDSSGVRDMNAFGSNVIRLIIPWSRIFIHRSLNKARSEEEKNNILDEYYKRFEQRVAYSPYEPWHIKLFNLAAVKE